MERREERGLFIQIGHDCWQCRAIWPRYQWSRRVEGKTVTVALSGEQFTWLKEAVANQRTIEDILSQMHQLTLEYMWKNLPSTPRRKKLSKKTLGTN